MDRVLWDGETCRYELEVFTGSRLGAGTKAPIKVALCGDRGRSEDVWLRKPINHHVAFQKGQHDVFAINTFYVGPLRKIQIGHDSQNVGKFAVTLNSHVGSVYLNPMVGGPGLPGNAVKVQQAVDFVNDIVFPVILIYCHALWTTIKRYLEQ